MSPSARASLAAKKRADHQISAIRPSTQLAPDSWHPRPGGDGHGNTDSRQVIAMAASRSRRDRTAGLGTILPLDGNNRIFATKLLAALAWNVAAGCSWLQRWRQHRHLRAECARVGLVAPADPGRQELTPTAAPDVRGALQVRVGAQVVVCAVPATWELHLCASADTLQALTGDIHPEDVTKEETSVAARRERQRPGSAPRRLVAGRLLR